MKPTALVGTLLAAVFQVSTLQSQDLPALPGLGNAFHLEKLSEMDAAINQAISEKKCPGAVLWVERNGVAYHKAYGKRALVPGEEMMTEDTIFDAASLTKVIACTPAIMLLVERDQIKLDERVQTYIPEFKDDDKVAISIRQLLTHTSGLPPGIGRDPPWSGYETAIRMACAEKLLSPPGAVFRYSDINFILLGEVVRRVGGMKLDEFVAREIYQPLKMVDSGYLPAASKLPRIAPTERIDGKILRGVVHDPTARWMGGVAGHAGIFTTAADLGRYARMLLNLGELDGIRVFKPETVRLMTSVQTPENLVARRGLGWDIDSGYSRPRGKIFPLGSYGHTGFTGTALWMDPFSKTFWIFLSNRVHPDRNGNVLPLEGALAGLAAQAVIGFNFSYVPGSLPSRPAEEQVAPTAKRTVTPKTVAVLNGIDVLVRQKFAPLKGLRVGLITNSTGHDRNRTSTIDLLHSAEGVQLKALFSLGRDIRAAGTGNDADGADARTGLPVYSLYGARRAPAPDHVKNLDALVLDIQDVGCRLFPELATIGNCLEAAAKAGVKFFVLDRVNPINGVGVGGPVYPGESSTAFHAIPLRTGMTVGELAKMFNAERDLNVNLTVIPVEGWTRALWFDQTELPWTNPTPEMRNFTGAILYPAVGLLEAAVSVGRGTDTPFEVIGAPYVDDVKLAGELNRAALGGVRFVPIRFAPKAGIFKDKPCGGVSILVSDRDALDMVDVGIALALTLERLYPNEFAIEKVQNLLRHQPTVDAIRIGMPLAEIKQLWVSDLEEFNKRRQRFLIYP